MKHSYYVVYNYYKQNASGSGCLMHIRHDKLDDLDKIMEMQSEVFRELKQDEDSITGLVIVNFILLSEVEA